MEVAIQVRKHGLVFNADSSNNNNTVTVYESTAGSRTIFLENSSGADIDSVIITTVTGNKKLH